MNKTSLPRLLAVLLFLLAAPRAGAEPHILWVSDPVRPDETLMVFGDGFDAGARVEIAAVDAKGAAASSWAALPCVESSRRCVKAVVPRDAKPGVFACRVRAGDATSNQRLVNAPDPWWVQGDAGSAATPGGWVRVLGKCLNGPAPTEILLQSPGGNVIRLKPQANDGWSLAVAVPESVLPGEYEISVWQGVAASAGHIAIVPRRQWKTTIFDVHALGGKIEAALQKAKANGGGVIYLPRGRYALPAPIVLPPDTLLKGEATDLVTLTPPVGKQKEPWIKGTTFAISDLTIYVEGEHGNVIQDSPESAGVRIERVRIRANDRFMVHELDRDFRGHVAPKSLFDNGAAISFAGSGFLIADCDIYASNRTMFFHGTHNGVVARNKFSYGGRGHGWDHLDGLIFEDNEIAGANLNSIGNDITTFWGKACEHIYYARNRVHDIYGADREMITLDAMGGAYLGRLAKAEGVKITLAADPDYKPNVAWAKPEDWRRAAVLIMDGKGAGQYRRVVKNSGREWEIDAPWEIAPDPTSLIQITYFRGRQLYIDNTFTDGGAVQMYGASFDTILSGNKGARMDGFLVLGLNGHDYGLQPCWFCQLLDNQILEGNGFGGRGGGIGVSGNAGSDPFAGAMTRCTLMRRNILQSNAAIAVNGASEDVVVENNAIHHNDVGIRISDRARGVVLRGNVFDDVAQQVAHVPVPAPATQPAGAKAGK